LTEAHFFQEKARELALPFRGFVLNRSRALNVDKPLPDSQMFPGVAIDKLQELARHELALASRDEGLLHDLQTRAGDSATAIALPELPAGADDMGTLIAVADVLARS